MKSEHDVLENDEDAGIRNALALKEEANERFKLGSYRDAIKLYTKAHDVCGGTLPVILSNRSAAWYSLQTSEGFSMALQDCRDCLRLLAENPDGDTKILEKVYLRGSKSLAELGRFDESLSFIMAAKDRGPMGTNKKINKQISMLVEMKSLIHETEAALASKIYSSARTLSAKLLRYTNASPVLCLLRVLKLLLERASSLRMTLSFAAGSEQRGCMSARRCIQSKWRIR